MALTQRFRRLPNGLLLLTLLANVACLAFYIIGPLEGLGSVKEPLAAVFLSVVWGTYGASYFVRSSEKNGRGTVLVARPV